MVHGDPVEAPMPSPKLSPLAYVGYYGLLFFAYWFGANRFDADGDGDFDPEDVQTFLADMGVVTRNFKKTKKNKGARGGATGAPGAGGSHPSSPQGPASPQSGPISPGSRGSGNSQPSGGGGGGIFSLDQNGDGQVDVTDIFESNVRGQSVEDYVRKQQRWPVFIVCESLFALLLWFGGSIHAASSGTASFMSAKAGIDSFSPGWSDLRLFSPMCEDWRGEVWRNFTYQWTHVGISHILMNCFMNLILGIPLEGLHGFTRMFVMYNIGVLGGAMCYWIGDAHKTVVGMSGGCYALIGIHVADLIMNWNQVKFRKIVVFFLFTLVLIDVVSFVLALGASNASHVAHVGGAIAGLLVGVCIGKNLVVKRYERFLQGAALVTGTILAIFCIAWMAAKYPAQNMFESSGYCWIRQIWNPQRFNSNDWVCVTCGSQACVSTFHNEQYIETVQASACITTIAN